MLQVNTESIRSLRERTGAGIMDCKRALEDSGGDLDKAEEKLKAAGIAKAAAKSHRATREGIIGSYVHAGGKIASMVEINCETDFVARTDVFQELAHNLAMQIAAMDPQFIDEDEMPEADNRSPEEVCLLRQSFIKDPSRSIADIVLEAKTHLGENVRVARIIRFGLGE